MKDLIYFETQTSYGLMIVIVSFLLKMLIHSLVLLNLLNFKSLFFFVNKYLNSFMHSYHHGLIRHFYIPAILIFIEIKHFFYFCNFLFGWFVSFILNFNLHLTIFLNFSKNYNFKTFLIIIINFVLLLLYTPFTSSLYFL